MRKKKNDNSEKGNVPAPSKLPLSTTNSDSKLSDLLASLSSRIDETESSIGALLKSTMTLSEQADSLPLLDRAKFFVTITYAIDSLIFSFLRTKGANYKDHPVMQELERVRIYIRKMNQAEQVPTERTMVVDRGAAQRLIIHGIPKSQIVPDPNTKSTTSNSGQKRPSPESDRSEKDPTSKKRKQSNEPGRSSAIGGTKSADVGKKRKEKDAFKEKPKDVLITEKERLGPHPEEETASEQDIDDAAPDEEQDKASANPKQRKKKGRAKKPKNKERKKI